jgi:peptidoglycan/xylan/chitin deacetylase (PgdA/CDA1 family)
MLAERFPDAVQQVCDHGHEVGCHGYDHANERAFDILSYDDQVADMTRAKKILSDVAGRVESFRAPALRLNEDTVRALEATGFRNDSSICSQRFDGPFTFGSKRKLMWLGAPRSPYFLSYDSVYKRGKSSIFEVPISAFVIPYSGTLLRRTPTLTRVLQRILYYESRYTGNPLTFLIHPNEFIPVGKVETPRRAKNLFGYIFADILRQKLKLKNLGPDCVRLLDELLSGVKKFDPEYLSIGSFKEKTGGIHGNHR